MKIHNHTTLILMLCLLFVSCTKDEIETMQAEGYIIGFSPCTINHHYKIGYVIISKDMKDTLVTYNLSDATFKMPASVLLNSSDTLYKIPESAFQNYRVSPFLPDSLRYKYQIEISYSIANESEKFYYDCTTDMLFLHFDQVIIKSATKF